MGTITLLEETDGTKGWFFVMGNGITLKAFQYNEKYFAEGRIIWGREHNFNAAKEFYDSLKNPSETKRIILFEETINN